MTTHDVLQPLLRQLRRPTRQRTSTSTSTSTTTTKRIVASNLWGTSQALRERRRPRRARTPKFGEPRVGARGGGWGRRRSGGVVRVRSRRRQRRLRRSAGRNLGQDAALAGVEGQLRTISAAMRSGCKALSRTLRLLTPPPNPRRPAVRRWRETVAPPAKQALRERRPPRETRSNALGSRSQHRVPPLKRFHLNSCSRADRRIP